MPMALLPMGGPECAHIKKTGNLVQIWKSPYMFVFKYKNNKLQILHSQS